jgi:hypothetical protein
MRMPLTQMADIAEAAAGPTGKIIEKTIRFLNVPHLNVLDKLLGRHLCTLYCRLWKRRGRSANP